MHFFASTGHHWLRQALTQINPGTIFYILNGILILSGFYYYVLLYCPCDFCPKLGHAKYFNWHKKVIVKSCPSFYEALTDCQREKMLLEEIGTRKRTGIAHLSDDALKKLMLSFKTSDVSSETTELRQKKLVGSHSYDILEGLRIAEEFQYVSCS